MLTEEQIRNADESAYMDDAQLEFFRARLNQLKSEIIQRQEQTKQELAEREALADPADRASAEEERFLLHRLRERDANLLGQVNKALRRIREGEYGWCENTFEPIGIPRLLARPMATTAVETKEFSEMRQRIYARVA